MFLSQKKKSLFLTILRRNHLSTKTRDTKHYYFLIHYLRKGTQCCFKSSKSFMIESGIGIATLIVGNTTLTSEEFEYFLLKKINHFS